MKKISQVFIVLILFVSLFTFIGGEVRAAEGVTTIHYALHQGNYTKTGDASAWLGSNGPMIAIRDLAYITGSTTAWYSDIGAVGVTNHSGFSLMSEKIKAVYKVEATVTLSSQDATADSSASDGTGEVADTDEIQTDAYDIVVPETSASSGQNQVPDDVTATVTWSYQKITQAETVVKKNDTNYLPTSYLSALGYTGYWDAATNTLHITVPTGIYLQTAPAEEITKAKAALKNDLPKGKICSYTTYYKTSQYNRTVNLTLATKAINGAVVQPGETFSFNNTVGPRTAARGYKVAIVYSGGKMVYGIGGGICQVSSTLYNTVLNGGFQVVERWQHSLPVSYVPSGKDATVSWGSADFRFKNNKSYAIKIVATASGGTLTVSFYYA